MNTIKIEDKITPNYSEDPGCYILHSTQFTKGICRLIDRDIQSILYIGKGSNLRSRVSSLQQSILSNCNPSQVLPKERGHQALSRKYFRIRKHIQTKNLNISFFTTPNHNPEIIESILLEKYVVKYGELPPLNGQYGKFSLEDAISLTKNIKAELDVILAKLEIE